MQANEETVKTRSVVGGPAWKALEAHYKKVRKLHLRKLFADDPTRGERLTASAVGIELDYAKNRITDETLKLLVQLAKDAGLRERIDAVSLRSSGRGDSGQYTSVKLSVNLG